LFIALPCPALLCPFLFFYAYAFRCHLEDVQLQRLHCRLFVQGLVRSLVHLGSPCPAIAATKIEKKVSEQVKVIKTYAMYKIVDISTSLESIYDDCSVQYTNTQYTGYSTQHAV
jgi:hypothetical protein